jgi:hypothetical protein
MPFAAALLLHVAVFAACTDRGLSAVDPNLSREQPKVIPVSHNRSLDLLFVVDDSPSMRQEQASLAVNFPLFVDVLESAAGGLPDLHLGVVSPNVGTGPSGGGGDACAGGGDRGVLQLPDGCPPLSDGARFISDIEIDEESGARLFNYTGDLADQFSCLAQLGTGGCGFEQPLEAAARALENRAENAGFLRDDAFLMVVFLTDEDDCSAADTTMFDPAEDDRDDPLGELSSFRCFEFGTTCAEADERAVGPRTGCVPGDDDTTYMTGVEPYIERIKALKPHPSRVLVAAISAAAAPVSVSVDPERDELRVDPACVVCPGGAATGCPLDPAADGAALVAAAPAIRLGAFLAGFPQRSTWQNICTYDPVLGDVNLAGALVEIASSFGNLPASWCLDDDLALPPECSVTEVTNPGTAEEEQTVIPPCDERSPTCFRLIEDPTCGTPSNLTLDIDRDGPIPTEPSEIVVRCLAE